MAEGPGWNDSATSLWRKIAQAYYELAVGAGFSGVEPNALDSKISSMRKVVQYAAFLGVN